MTRSLDDCRFQIARAKKKFDALHSEIAEFVKENPINVTTEIDPQTQQYVLHFPDPPRIPRDWGSEAAEIGGNCRSSLNYLVVLLVTEPGGQDDRNLAFPLAESETDYLKPGRGGVTYRDRSLAGVPEPLRRRIDEFQPYNDGPLAYRHPLALLAEITNSEKHRAPQAAFATVQLPLHTVRLQIGNVFRGFTIRLSTDISVEAEVGNTGSLVGPSIALEKKVQMEGRLAVELVFGSNDAARYVSMNDLARIIEVTERIVESVAPNVEA